MSCEYGWGPRSPKWGDPSVTVSVMDASKAWPGLSADQIEQGVMLSVKHEKGGSSALSGIGDAAVFSFDPDHFNCKTQAFFAGKKLHLALDFHGSSTPSCKDNVVSLLKRAASRL